MKLTLESATKVVQLDECLLEDFLESRVVRNPRVAYQVQDAHGENAQVEAPTGLPSPGIVFGLFGPLLDQCFP